MLPNVADTQPSSARSLRIEDIVTIEDASLYAREHAPDIPAELLRRVWRARTNLRRGELREVAIPPIYHLIADQKVGS